LSGLLIDNAQDLIKKPALTDDDLMKLFNRTMQDAVSVGLTSIHDAGLDPMSLEFFKRQALHGKTTSRSFSDTVAGKPPMGTYLYDMLPIWRDFITEQFDSCEFTGCDTSTRMRIIGEMYQNPSLPLVTEN
jgi:hypothetical protein